MPMMQHVAPTAFLVQNARAKKKRIVPEGVELTPWWHMCPEALGPNRCPFFAVAFADAKGANAIFEETESQNLSTAQRVSVSLVCDRLG